jgi:hypothetical protein
MKAALYFCLLSLTAFAPAADKNEWMLKRGIDGINIYSRRSDFSRFDDTKVDMELTGTIEQLAAILRDIDRYSDWVYATRITQIVKRLNENEVIYYGEIGTPWPAANRDYFADLKISFNPDDRSMNVLSVALKDYQPEKKDLVRVPLLRGHWLVTTESAKKIHLQYILELDPGGAIPGWILNNFAARAPFETFSNLKKKMEELNR